MGSDRRTERIAEKRQHVPKRYLSLFDRCIAGQASPREAIKLFCLECWAYVRSETATCDNWACPLQAYRPYQNRAMSPTGPPGAPSIDEPE